SELKGNIWSCDAALANGTLQAFNPLFPPGSYFGERALIGPANHIGVHPALNLALLKKVTLGFDWDFFWRENTHDGIYGPAVNVIQSGKTSDAQYVGNQVEALLVWRIDRHFTASADYAHFFAGDFLNETTLGKDVECVSTWVTYR